MTVAATELTAAQRAALAARADQVSTVVPPPGGQARRRPAATRPEPLPAPVSRPSRPRSSTGTGRPAAPRPAAAAGRRRGGQQRSMFDQVRRAAPTTPVHRGNYQPVILAEFVAAVLLVSISPIASKKNPKGLSPYAGQDMIKIAAVTATYFVLALISATGQGAGRYAAWFGGLILLAVGLNEAANVAKALDLAGFGGSPPSSDAVTGTTQTGSTVAGRN